MYRKKRPILEVSDNNWLPTDNPMFENIETGVKRESESDEHSEIKELDYDN